MSPRRTRPFRVLGWLIAARGLGERRYEIQRDLEELFHTRVATHGAGSAHLRYLVDVLSLWTQAIQKIDPVIGGTRAGWGSGILTDIVYAARVFLARPGLAVCTVLGLALAIGVGTSVFAVLNAVALRPLGVPDPTALMRVLRTSTGSVSTGWSYGDALALRERSTRVPLEIWLDADGIEFATEPKAERPIPVRPRFVGGAYFPVLGGHARFGRLLTATDDTPAAAPVMVIDHQFWVRELGSDPGIVGRTVWLNNSPFTVVGVTARGLSDSVDRTPSFWIALGAYSHVGGRVALDRSAAQVALLARVPSGSSEVEAQADVAAVAAALARDRHGTAAPPGAGARFERLDARMTGPQAGRIRTAIAVVITAIGLMLLLACANVTNLQLASAASRHREIGVRLALGATRGRLIRQLLTESLLLGLAGGALGLLVAMWGLPILAAMMQVPADLDTSFDVRVYLFVAAASVLAGIGAGLAPARHGARGDLLSPLKGTAQAGGPAPARRWRSALIGTQAAASVVLLVLALLLARATTRAARIDLGFEPARLVTFSTGLRNQGYDDSRARAFWQTAGDALRALPAVESAALVLNPPFGDSSMITSMHRNGRRYTVYYNEVSADYFSTLGLRVVQGRTFTSEEVRSGAPVVVVSEEVAREFWGGESPVGRPFDRINDETPAPRIIGIVANAVTARLRDTDGAAVYMPLKGRTMPAASIVVRARSTPEAIVQPVQAALRAIDPDLRPSATIVGERVARQLNEPRSLASLAGAIGVIALALALIGIYGVAAFLVGQRSVEIGVRMAIGATLQNVVAMLLRDTLRPVAVGLAAGIVLAVLAAQVLAGILFGVSVYDPVSISGAVALLSVSAALAVLIPARRAARVDPASVLRS